MKAMAKILATTQTLCEHYLWETSEESSWLSILPYFQVNLCKKVVVLVSCTISGMSNIRDKVFEKETVTSVPKVLAMQVANKV